MSLNKTSLTSDRDYLKIFRDGPITISANGVPDADSTFPVDPSAPSGFAGSTTINHNLGYIPLVRAFWDPDKNGLWYASESYDTSLFKKDPWLKFLVSTTSVKLIMNTDGGAKTNIPVFYRIYEFGNEGLSSDDRIDKIFFKGANSGIVAASPNSFTMQETIVPLPHGEIEAPLFGMQFSENQLDWYEMGTRIVGPFDTASGPPGGPYSRYYFTVAFVTADATNLYIHLQSNYSSQKTLYFRCEADYRQ